MTSPVRQWKWLCCAHSAPKRPGCLWESYSPVQLCLWPGQRYSTLPSYQFSALHGLLKDRKIIFQKIHLKQKLVYNVCKYTVTYRQDPPLESTFTARISAFSGMHSFLGVRWKQSGTLGVPPVLTTCSNTLKETKSTLKQCHDMSTHHLDEHIISIFQILTTQVIVVKTNNNRIIHVCTCSSSILRSRQSCSSDDGSESAGAAVLWVLILLDVPGNFTATYAPSTLST